MLTKRDSFDGQKTERKQHVRRVPCRSTVGSCADLSASSEHATFVEFCTEIVAAALHTRVTKWPLVVEMFANRRGEGVAGYRREFCAICRFDVGVEGGIEQSKRGVYRGQIVGYCGIAQAPCVCSS